MPLVFITGLDHVGKLQGRHDMATVEIQIRHDRGAQVGIDHHRTPGLALAGQPGQIDIGIVGRQGQGAGAHQGQDFGLSFTFMGSVAQTIGGMLILPTRLEAIRAGVEQARSDLRAAELARNQYQRDLAASFVLNLYVLRNNERQIRLFDGSILPRARQTVALAQTAYATNRVGFVEVLDSERTLLDVRRLLSQLRTEREKAIAAIETWSAVDVEVLQSSGMSVRASPMGSSRRPARAMTQGATAEMGNK